MNQQHRGYRCGIQFDGHKYVVTRLRGGTPPFAFYQKDVGKTIRLSVNQDKHDLFCYCRTAKKTTILTVPAQIAHLIKKGRFPITF